MEFKKGKWIRQSKTAAILLLVGAMLLAIYGSFAAYTNFNSVKRVVSTGTQSDTMFGSNYLSLMNLSDTSIPVKRISLAGNDNNYTFTVQVCNYVWGDPTLYNPKDIKYKVTAKLISMDGGKLPDNCTDIKMGGQTFGKDGALTLESRSLATGSAQTKSYSIVIPKDLKDKIKIKIEAVPENISADAVNNQKLGAILSFADYEATKNWTGHFIDSKEYAMPEEIVLQLSHKDVYLGFFRKLKREVLALRGGDLLNYDNFVLYDSLTNKPVAKLSQNMQNTLAEWKEKGYEVKSASVRFVVAWKPKEAPKDEPETAVLLADLLLSR